MFRWLLLVAAAPDAEAESSPADIRCWAWRKGPAQRLGKFSNGNHRDCDIGMQSNLPAPFGPL